MSFLSDSGMTIKQVVDALELQIKALEEQIMAVEELKTKIEEMNNKIELLLDVELGNWEIKNNQMIFYDSKGSELARFNLYNSRGERSSIAVCKRERV